MEKNVHVKCVQCGKIPSAEVLLLLQKPHMLQIENSTSKEQDDKILRQPVQFIISLI